MGSKLLAQSLGFEADVIPHQTLNNNVEQPGAGGPTLLVDVRGLGVMRSDHAGE